MIINVFLVVVTNVLFYFSIPELLHEIMNYRFNRKFTQSSMSVKTADSGISEGGLSSDSELKNISEYKI